MAKQKNKTISIKWTFWFPVIVDKQLDFEGREHNAESLGEGHIVYNEVLLCGESRERLKNQSHAAKEKKVELRPARASICPLCQELYKKHPMSPYARFVSAPPTRTQLEGVKLGT